MSGSKFLKGQKFPWRIPEIVQYVLYCTVHESQCLNRRTPRITPVVLSLGTVYKWELFIGKNNDSSESLAADGSDAYGPCRSREERASAYVMMFA